MLQLTPTKTTTAYWWDEVS